jgi:hypothetical protein
MDNRTKALTVLGCTPIIKDCLEELVEQMPSIFRQSLKKATNEFIREIDKVQNQFFAGTDETKNEMADQLNAISVGFEDWINYNFEQEVHPERKGTWIKEEA